MLLDANYGDNYAIFGVFFEFYWISDIVISIEFDLFCHMRCECEVETKFENLIGLWLHGKTQNS